MTTETPRDRAIAAVAEKIWEIHGPESTDRESAEMEATDIISALLASPDILRELAGQPVLCCDWCEATVKLDDDRMVVAHHRPDDGATCPGSHGDDYTPATTPSGGAGQAPLPLRCPYCAHPVSPQPTHDGAMVRCDGCGTEWDHDGDTTESSL